MSKKSLRSKYNTYPWEVQDVDVWQLKKNHLFSHEWKNQVMAQPVPADYGKLEVQILKEAGEPGMLAHREFKQENTINNSKARKFRKRKKLRAKRVAKTATVVKKLTLWEELEKEGHKLHEGLKDDKYVPLLRTVGRFRSSGKYRWLNEVFDNKDFFFTTCEELFTSEPGTQCVYTLEHAAFVRDSAASPHALLMPVKISKDHFIVAYMGPSTTTLKTVKKTAQIFGHLHNKRVLPADIRKWPTKFAWAYFKAKLQHSKMLTKADSSRYRAIFGKSYTDDKVHQIRKINPAPSRAQIMKIERDKAARHNVEADMSFSLNQ
jgi:hypothetical protein